MKIEFKIDIASMSENTCLKVDLQKDSPK